MLALTLLRFKVKRIVRRCASLISFIPQRPRLRLAKGSQDFLRREWHLQNPYAHGIVKRIRNRGRYAKRAGLAHTLRPEGPALVRLLDELRHHLVRHIQESRNFA